MRNAKQGKIIIGIASLALAAGTVGVIGAAGPSGGGSQQGSGKQGEDSVRSAVQGGRSQAFGDKARGSGGFPPGKHSTAVGLTDDGRLAAFLVAKPGAAVSLGKVNGLKGDSKLVGIDFRVQNKALYGVGDQGGIYTLRTLGAKATKVSQLTVPLQGKSFGVDFNPAANRLRVISDTGQNLRHNLDDPAGAPAAGSTAADGTLTNPPAPPAPGATALGVSAAAYTNNDLDAATATTLFDIDTTGDQVSVQSPANNGNLAPAGKLGVDAGSAAGFDIYFSSRSGTNTGYATLQAGGSQQLYKVNLLTGKATSVGAFPSGGQVIDLALPLNQG